MIDLLVRLYDLPDSGELYRKVEEAGVRLRRPNGYERHIVADFVRRHFSPKWVSEAKVAFSRQPPSCFIATKQKEIVGFACYETTMKGYFGPTGVAESARGMGLGKALLFKALEALRDDGYAYAVIGGVGPREFYEKACGAFEIPGSNPGIFADLLPDP
jgi:ribosomal protein S18 acetylase RimI-like enzyme